MSAHDPTVVGVVSALDVEAKPIARAWSLERQRSGPFTIYRGAVPGSRNPAVVIVSGVGRAASAAATSWLAAEAGTRSSPEVWVNYGIGGSANHIDRSNQRRNSQIGDVLVAARVIDEEARRRQQVARSCEGRNNRTQRVPVWYPPWILDVPANNEPLATVARGTVRTVDAPELNYPDEGVYDMEAVAFMETALRFQTAEFVQVVKVVSDTPAAGVQQLDRERVLECAQSGIDVLTALVTELVRLVERDDVLVGSDLALASSERAALVGLSVSQQHLWDRQVERLESLVGERQALKVLQSLRAGERREALGELTDRVDALATEYGGELGTKVEGESSR